MPDFTACPDPDCGLPAEVVDDYTADSTCGPVRHLRTRCLDGHWCVSLAD